MINNWKDKVFPILDMSEYPYKVQGHQFHSFSYIQTHNQSIALSECITVHEWQGKTTHPRSSEKSKKKTHSVFSESNEFNRVALSEPITRRNAPAVRHCETRGATRGEASHGWEGEKEVRKCSYQQTLNYKQKKITDFILYQDSFLIAGVR